LHGTPVTAWSFRDGLDGDLLCRF